MKTSPQKFKILYFIIILNLKRFFQRLLLHKNPCSILFQFKNQNDQYLNSNGESSYEFFYQKLTLILQNQLLSKTNNIIILVSENINFLKLISIIKEISKQNQKIIIIFSTDEFFTEKIQNMINAGILNNNFSYNLLITHQTVYFVDEFLEFLKNFGIDNYSFSFENNSPQLSIPMTNEECFHLSMFFEKLSRIKKINSIQRINYRQISQELATGNLNLSEFSDQSFSVTLDLNQNMVLHFPTKKSLFQYPRKKILKIYQRKFSDKWNVYADKSSILFFDPDALNTSMIFTRAKEVIGLTLKHKISTINQIKTGSPKIKPAIISSPLNWRKVLITGWYGTETTGDKAILAEVVHFIKQNSPDCEVIITTINEKISLQSNRELADLKNAKLVKLENANKPGLIESVDAVIFGGGPIMQSNAMQSIWKIFFEANLQQKARIIFGCGVGPIHTEEMKKLIADVLQMSTAGFLRDQESKYLADQLAPDNNFGVACDPALAYLYRWYNQNKDTKIDDSHQIATLLRANTNEFIVDMDKQGLENANQQIASKIASILEPFCASHRAKAKLLAMNAPWIGGDDRLFNRLVGNSFSNRDLVDIERAYYPLDAVIQSLYSSNIAIAMRYHGHLFCMALGIPFLSIDYTGKSGKVSSLLKRIGYDGFSQNWRDMQPESAIIKLAQIFNERGYWSDKLMCQSKDLIEKLQATYSQVFPEINSLQ